MCIIPVFTIAKQWNWLQCPITDEWIKEMQDKYFTEYYLSIKKNEIMSFAGKWMELGKISQAHKAKHHVFLSFVEFKPKMVIIIVAINNNGT
jgi:hypothetical protein